MVAGHLHEKNGYYYMILNLNDENGNRKPKWIPTHLTVKGNKKKAEEMLMQARRQYSKEPISNTPNMLFTDYMLKWLKECKYSIELATYSSYEVCVKSIIVPYFREHNDIALPDLKPQDITSFYQHELERVKATTVIHYHAVIHKALKEAVDKDLITSNPADKVKRPKKEQFIGGFYNENEVHELFRVAEGTPLELAVLFGAFYGLRRSEIIGLKWDAIDFDNNTITIKHTVTSCTVEGKRMIVAKDRAKTKSSLRSLPLVPFFRDKLLKIQAQQEENKRLCGRSYCKEYLDYIYVDELGNRIKPNYITERFPVLLNKNGLRKIRFHDLRHSCASLLLKNGIPLKQIQEWLGHSDFSTTANIYAHLEYQSKMSSANSMNEALGLGND